jgi:DNA-binding NarL/FixJ family response regulator
MPELVVAHVAAGRPNEAERCLRSIAGAHHAGPLPSARLDRARAAVRGDDDLFVRAAADADDATLPIEASETRLAHAEHIARDGRRDESRALAERVRAELTHRGVHGWTGRIGRLLEVATPAGEVAGELTSAEYRVAVAVADGATNREAAAKLFLSVKTVDFHLQNIYRKLGLRSRTELAVRLSRSTSS